MCSPFPVSFSCLSISVKVCVRPETFVPTAYVYAMEFKNGIFKFLQEAFLSFFLLYIFPLVFLKKDDDNGRAAEAQ